MAKSRQFPESQNSDKRLKEFAFIKTSEGSRIYKRGGERQRPKKQIHVWQEVHAVA
jgi:hypothetical protein